MLYTADSTKSLADFIAEIIDKNSTIVIPDLQRPYIWDPDQVILLIDSLFKKWPFGSLLCWNVKITTETENHIPYRPFWQEVARDIPDRESVKMSSSEGTNTFLMILDGQQRMQSLLLALGGAAWGFVLPDKEWKRILEKKEESGDPRVWSKGCLCLDLDKFLVEYNSRNRKIGAIEIGRCLRWVIMDELKGVSNPQKKHTLPVYSSARYIRFSLLWDAAKPGQQTAEDYAEILKSKDDRFSKEDFSDLLTPLAQFMAVIADVKNSTPITRLTVKEFALSGIEERHTYNNAIVNIFARLNSAGRSLSPQEITLAWLKLGWREASQATANTDNAACETELVNLLSDLNDREEGTRGLQMTMDNLVDTLSMLWLVTKKRDGKITNEQFVLGDDDLVNGDIIKSIGKETFQKWNLIKQTLHECKDAFEGRHLNELFTKSFNAFNILCGWRYVSLTASNRLQGRVRDTEIRFGSEIDNAFDNFVDRWFFGTQLAGTWSDTNSYPTHLKDLYELQLKLQSSVDSVVSTQLLAGQLKTWLSNIEQPAIQRIQDLRAYTRREVSGYKNVLWLWNRIDRNRWESARDPMKRKSAEPKLEVDHSIPVAIWNNMVETSYPVKDSRDPATGTEKKMPIGTAQLTRSEIVAFINSLGNCSLLLRSHNRSKSDEPFGDFLADIYKPEKIEAIRSGLGLSSNMLAPTKSTIETLYKDIEDRTKAIKQDLEGFFRGTKNRVDIT